MALPVQLNLAPTWCEKTLNLARDLSLKEVKDLLKKVLDLDIKLKTPNHRCDDAVQHLLITL